MFDKLSAYQSQLLSILRIVAGLMFMQHGLQKIFGFPAPAMMPFDLVSQMGVGGVLELVGGAMLAVGLFTRCAALVLSGMMAVAYFQFHWKFGAASPFPLVNQGELAVLYCFTFLYISAAGGGAWSVDNLLKRNR